MWFKKRNSRPTAEDAARRLVILKHVVVSALVAPPREMFSAMSSQWSADEKKNFQQHAKTQRDQFWQGLRDAGLWRYLSPREQVHAQSTMVTMTTQQQIDATWRVEAVQALMWALGMLAELPPYDTAQTTIFSSKSPRATWRRSSRARGFVNIPRLIRLAIQQNSGTGAVARES